MTTQTVSFGTVPLYGVLFTSKSFLLGVRHVIDGEHAKFLAYRTAGHRLPTEIVDQIAESILDLYDKDAVRIIRPQTSKDRKDALNSALYMCKNFTTTVAGRNTKLRIASLREGLQIVLFHLDKPGGGHETVVHVSADHPSLSLIIPGSVPATGGPAVMLDGGRVKARCRPALQSDIPALDLAQARYQPGKPIGRMLQIDDIEEVVKNWDPTAVERLVEGLKLEPVRVQGEVDGPLKPRLRISQMIS